MRYILVTLLLYGNACTSLKDVKNNSGAITVGNHNIVINFPQDNVVYSNEEIQSNIQYLQTVISQMNSAIAPPSSNQTENKAKEQKENEGEKDEGKIFSPNNQLKEQRERAFDALKQWENLYSKKHGIAPFLNENSRLVNAHKIRADSFEGEVSRLHLENALLINDILNKNAKSGRIDSIITELTIQSIGGFPKGTVFIEELDAYSYKRMLTLWEEKIEKLKSNITGTRITITNTKADILYVAIRYFALDKQWVTQGYYTFEPNEKKTLPIYTRKSELYIHAHHPNKTSYTFEGSSKFQIVSNDSFTLLETYKITGVPTEEIVFSSTNISLGSDNPITF